MKNSFLEYDCGEHVFIDKNTGFETKAKMSLKVARRKHPRPFVTTYIPTILDYISKHPESVKLICFLMSNMNTHNRLEMSIEKITSRIGESKRKINYCYSQLKKDGIIKNKRCATMFNPIYAVRCKVEELDALYEEWETFGTENDTYKKNKKICEDSNKAVRLFYSNDEDKEWQVTNHE